MRCFVDTFYQRWHFSMILYSRDWYFLLLSSLYLYLILRVHPAGWTFDRVLLFTYCDIYILWNIWINTMICKYLAILGLISVAENLLIAIIMRNNFRVFIIDFLHHVCSINRVFEILLESMVLCCCCDRSRQSRLVSKVTLCHHWHTTDTTSSISMKIWSNWT